MKIAALLAWYDESPDALTRTITSLAGIADTLVELDGAWAGTPTDGSFRSPRDQRDALREAAIRTHIPIIGRDPVSPYQSQVEKRDQLFRLALARTDASWFLVIDGDEHIAERNPPLLRSALTKTEHDVALVTLRNIDHDTEYSGQIRRLYRAATRPSVVTAHNGYRTKDGRYLHGDPAFVTLEEAETKTAALLRINHDSSHRTPQRLDARASYRRMRRDHGLEEWRAA